LPGWVAGMTCWLALDPAAAREPMLLPGDFFLSHMMFSIVALKMRTVSQAAG